MEILEWPLTGEGRDKRDVVLEHSSAIKRNEAHATEWEHLKNIMLRVISHTVETMCYIIPFIGKDINRRICRMIKSIRGSLGQEMKTRGDFKCAGDGNGNVPKLDCGVVAQLRLFTKNHKSVHLKWVNVMVS